MKPRINLKKIWSDEDVIELKVEVTDGESTFFNKVYISHKDLEELIKDLETFSKHIHGGLYDIKFGMFGPEYANGAFQARLHFKTPGTLYISTHQQSDFQEFSKNLVASEAKMYLKTEPVLLDNFITELKSLNSDNNKEVGLECI
jgi:hypothetical protein